MTRKIYNTIVLSAAALAAVGCNFAQINIDPNHNSEIKPGPLLTYTQLNTSVDGHTKNMQIGTCMALVQQASSTLTTEFGAGDKYYMMDAACNQYFLDFYSTAIKNWRELEVVSAKDPEYKKMQGVAKIWGAYLFQRMTDLYGDVPYKEAGMGYHQQNYKPAYDPQADIYHDLINQVREGIKLLDEEGKPIEGDLFFDGNVEKWKKFGNSVLLHLGMRLCKVEPELAKTVAAEAIQGGIMEKAEESARVQHIAGGRDAVKNQVSLRFMKDAAIKEDKVKVSETFVNYLKATADPRLTVLCSTKDGNNAADQLFGMPNGYDKETLAQVPGSKEVEKYCTFSTRNIIRDDAPTILMTASETLLLKAEAILRGWAAGDANAIYEQAVKVGMAEMDYFYGVKIAEADVNAYLAQKLFEKAAGQEGKLEVLGQQYWVSTFMNGYESFANWRRSGYPKLTPTNYAGNLTNGTMIPRRLLYSSDEYSINAENLQKAIERQGEDKVTTRIWWDK